jgi:tetratricopeptide repeat protein 8
MDKFFVATSRYNRQRYDECIEICNELLEKNSLDQAAWLLKCKALTKKSYVDDIEIDEEGVADILMDDNAITQAPRPGTSFSRPLSSAGQPGGISQNIRPMSSSGRPMSGYQRPGTNRAVTG